MCVCVLAVPRAKVWMPSLQGSQEPQSGHWRPTGWHLQKPQDRCHGQGSGWIRMGDFSGFSKMLPLLISLIF